MKRVGFNQECLSAVIVFTLLASNVFSAPKIACRQPEYDFGKAETGKNIEHTFTIWNDGDKPLNIGNLRACCGATMKIKDMILAPGTNTALKTDISLRNRYGKLSKSFYIASDDPTQPYYQLRCVGTVTAEVHLEPESLDFGFVAAGAHIEKHIRLNCQTNVNLNINNIASDTKEFAARYSRLENGGYDICVITVPPLQLGITRGYVNILTDHPKYASLKVPVWATVASEFVVVPKEIVLTGNNSTNVVTRYIAIRSRDGSLFMIEGMEFPDNDVKIVKTELSSGFYRIELSNIMPFTELNGKQVTIKTDRKTTNQIIIPIRVTSPQIRPISTTEVR